MDSEHYDKMSFMSGLAVGRLLWDANIDADKREYFAFTVNLEESQNFTIYRIVKLAGYRAKPLLIIWGDGIYNILTNSTSLNVMHIYPKLGTYTIIIVGEFLEINMNTGYGPYRDDGVERILTPFPKGLRSAQGAFTECRALKEIPENLFSRCATTIESVRDCFAHCEEISSIPSGLFSNCSKITDFSSCFSGCDIITEIPSGLFSDCSNAETFAYCFAGRQQVHGKIRRIPDGLFDRCHKAYNFNGTFAYQDIRYTPDMLFSFCYSGPDTNFADTFYSNENLIDLSENMFDFISFGYFLGTFNGCTSLTRIPEGLFASCVDSIEFGAVFAGCDSLTEIPERLFEHCVSAESFRQSFRGCGNVSGSVPSLWNTFPGADGYQCFDGCTNASNYEDIPAEWK